MAGGTTVIVIQKPVTRRAFRMALLANAPSSPRRHDTLGSSLAAFTQHGARHVGAIDP